MAGTPPAGGTEPSDSAASAQLSRRRRLGSVGILALAHAVNDSYAYVLQALLPAVIPALGLTLGLAGGLVALYQLTSSVVQPLLGHLADRSRVRWPAWAGVAASGIAAGSLGLAPQWTVLAGLLLLGGLGTALFHPVSAAMVGAAAPPASRGRWMGLYVTAGSFGTAFGPLAVGPLLERSGPAGTWPIMLPGLLVALLVLVLAPPRRGPARGAPALGAILRTYGRVLASLVVIVALRAWATTALITFIPLLGRMRGLSLAEAAHALTIYLLSGAAGGLIGGFLADRLGRDRVLVGALLLSAPFGVFLALTDQAGLSFLAAASVCGFLLNGSYVVLVIRGQESVPGSAGMVNGILLGFSVGLGGLAVAPLALLSERTGVPVAAALAALLGALAALATRLLPPTSARPA